MEEKLINGKCIGLNENGQGIVLYNQTRVFVPYLLEGEEAQVKLTIKTKDFYIGEIVSLKTKSNVRVKPICALYEECGGCHYQHLSYEAQLDHKKQYVIEMMKNIGRFNVSVPDVIGMKNPYRYRNKIQIAFAPSKRGVKAGFYQENTHKVISIDKCDIQDEYADKIIQSIKEIMVKLHIPPYNEDNGTGLIRHVLVKRGFHTNHTMVVLVVSQEMFPGRNNFVKALLEKHKDITTIIQNTNSRKTSIVLGDKERVLYGKGYIEDVLCGYRFKISAKSFYQVNPVQTEILYNKAIEFAQLTGNETILDAYCGIGTIGIVASSKAKEVIGVEANGDAVKDAIGNAKLNKIQNIRFYRDSAEDFMESLVENKIKIDVVFLDPPRKGCELKFIEALGQLKPKKIVYISCDPSTQARDLNQITRYGYEVKHIQPVDMFPHTYHVENVVLLVKK